MQASAGAQRAPKWKQAPAPPDRQLKYAASPGWNPQPGSGHAAPVTASPPVATDEPALPPPPPPTVRPPSVPAPGRALPPPGPTTAPPPELAGQPPSATATQSTTVANAPRSERPIEVHATAPAGAVPPRYARAVFGARPPFPLPAAAEAALRAAYARPPRAYHSAAHVDEVVGEYERVAAADGWDQPGEVYWAILCHDAIYVAGQRDNEARSAGLARQLAGAHLRGVGLELDRVEALILLTARHGGLDGGALDRDAARFVDCDMAILGAPPTRFDAYDAAIALEFAHVPAAAYRAGRGRFLAALLAAPRIYCSDGFHARLDAAARANLRRALAATSPA